MARQEYLTKEEKIKLEAELHELESTKRQEILDTLQFAKSLGDLSENAEYHQARDAQGRNEARIEELKQMLKNSVVVDASKSETITVGSHVTLLKTATNEKKDYVLVGTDDSDILSGKLSYKSPLGTILMGKAKGAVVEVKTPSGVVEYKVSKIG